MKKIMLLLCLVASAVLARSQKIVSGTVTNAEDGTPLAKVNVLVSGSTIGTSTNEAGKYSISVPANAILIFTRIGFNEISQRAGTSGTIDVALQLKRQDMEQVVVTGYTTQTRRQSTSSISKVGGDDVKSQPIGSFEQLLQGKAPGLLIQSQSGQPGSAATVTIRGKGSFLGSTEPLYIVDGIEISPSDFASVNPSDFESYNVLKDAMGTAQYGSRGANGVIVITTKKGIARKTLLSYDMQYGTSQLPENKLELMSSADKINYELNYDRPDGMNPFGWTPGQADSLSKIQGDLKDVLFRRGNTAQHQLSLSGGNEKTKFFASGSIFDQQGVVITTGLRRITGRLNLDHTAGNFRLGVNTYIGTSTFTGTNENDQFIGTPLNAIRWTNPYVTAYLPDGSYNLLDMDLQGQPNPVKELLGTPGSTKQLKLIGSVSIEYKVPFIKGLSLKTNAGIDYTNNDNQQYFDKDTYQGSQATGGEGLFAQNTSKNNRQIVTTSINYTKKSGYHAYNVGLFNEYINTKFNSFGFTGYGLVGPFKNGAGITPGTSSNGFIPVVASNATQDALMSYFAIGDYSYKNKYFLSGTIREDGSSKLAEGSKWTTFGAVGAGWLISSEHFMRNSKAINELKLRGSYGSSASQAVSSYAALEQFSPTSYNGVAGLILTNLKNGQLTWEVRRTLDLGVDFALFKNRLSGTVEYYDGTTHGLFLNRQISGTNGTSSIITNLGKLQNQGIEVSLNLDVVRIKEFTWSVGGNFTYNKNKILQLDGTDENIDPSGTVINRVGQAANSAYLVRYAGVDPANGDALYYTKDGKNTTNQYDPNDKVIVGKLDPPYFGGFNTSLKFRGLEASVLFTYSFGNKVINGDRANVENPGYWFSGISKELLTEWQKPGDITNIPSPFSDFQTSTTRFLEDGKFIRLKNITLSYTLPSAVISKAKISSIRFFIQGQNLYVWSKFKGYDPEIATGQLTGAQYPALKAFTVGLNASF